MDHIDDMEELKNGIGLRAYGQKDPVVQYRIEGTDMFDEMNENIKLDVVKILSHIEKVGNVVRTSNVKDTKEGFDETAVNLVDGKLAQSDKNFLHFFYMHKQMFISTFYIVIFSDFSEILFHFFSKKATNI